MFSDRVIVVSIVHRPGTRGVTIYTFVLLLIYKFKRLVPLRVRLVLLLHLLLSPRSGYFFHGILANAASSSCFVLYFSFVFMSSLILPKYASASRWTRAAVLCTGFNHLVDGV